MRYKPHQYQAIAEQYALDHPRCGLFLDMGLGKTVITLTVIDKLIYDYFEVTKGRVLVIAPLRVAEDTWSRESSKWDHLQHLRISKVLGSAKRRLEALSTPADLYIINRDNVVWLIQIFGNQWPFDMVVVDELSSFKNPKSQRFKALKKLSPLFKRFVGLTGTPAPRNLMDLWSELYLIDRGERLGKTMRAYQQRYFVPGRRNGYVVYDYIPIDGAERQIYDRISDVCMSMTAADWLQLPDRIDLTREIQLPTSVMAAYRRFEREKYLELMDGDNPLLAANAGVLAGKLTQFSNGAVYLEDHSWQPIHDCKLDELEQLIEEANGQSVMVFYNFKHDFQRLIDRFAAYEPRMIKNADDIADWNAGKIQLLLAHPASMGHGLNLQDGGHIVIWFGLTWDLEIYQQANARLHRQGQQQSVRIYHIICKGTVDEDILRRLQTKDANQQALIDAVKARVERLEE
ncbi:DEAD/DEAH box helicase [Holdemania massiliensis]|uniref:DEAD/DEAH box helicase n=1 Tax=Holdemania massiliensis TaxID=1468449 RepID=UPI001F06134C|nr:DEAD/DEAH box helicase [Holdemania massiliensis]MCH1940012.1 DEAD/DEAH box helicase [Holdemania massiliensis]